MSAGCLVQPPEVKPTEEEIRACIKDDKLLLASGKKIPKVRNACLEPLPGDRLKMPVAKGRVEEKTVDVLRDTGCSGIVVKKNLASEDELPVILTLCCSLTTQRGRYPLQELRLLHLISRG